MTCNKIKTGLRSSPPQSTGRLTRVVLSCSSVRSSKQARVRSLATTRAAIVGQSSSYNQKTHVLQMMYPSFLTGQNVHKLFPNGRLAESRNRLVLECLRNGCHMVQQKFQTLVHRTMQFNDSRFGEHDFTLPLRHNF